MRGHQHALVQKLIEVASKIGRAPTEAEFFRETGFPAHVLASFDGNYSVFLQAAGLRIEKPKSKDAWKNFIQRDIPNRIEKQNELFPVMGPFTPTAVFGDLHEPHSHPDAKTLAYAVLEKMTDVETIVQVGDAFDFYSFSKFPRTYLVQNPQEEVEAGRTAMEEFWRCIQRIKPHARCIQLIGNHDLRPHKRLLEQAPALEALLDIQHLWEFDGVETIHDARKSFTQDNVSYWHGFRSGLHSADFPTTHLVHGHTHRGGLVIKKIPGRPGSWYFELDVGYLGFPESVCFRYTPVKSQNWTRGMGYVSKWGPVWIPFE